MLAGLNAAFPAPGFFPKDREFTLTRSLAEDFNGEKERFLFLICCFSNRQFIKLFMVYWFIDINKRNDYTCLGAS